MSTATELTAAAEAGAQRAGTVRVGRTDYVVERPSARKASTALRLIRRVSGTVKTVTRELGHFEREYAQDHAIDLDRVQARMRYPARVVYDADGELVRDTAGEVVMRSPLDAMSDDDWARAGEVLRLPMAPNLAEKVGAVLDLALEDAEDEVYRLLALFTLANDDVARAKREQRLDEVLEERADLLLDEGALDEVLELAVVISETIDAQFTRKASELGDRLGNVRRLLGLAPAPEAPTPPTAATTPQTTGQDAQTDDEQETSTSSSRPTSSSASDSPSDGPPTPSSTPTTPSSSPSGNGSTSNDAAPTPPR